MVAVRLQTARATSLLIVRRRAGSMNPAVEAKVRKAFDGSLIVDFDPKMDLEKLITPTATVVAAGGDGTIGWVDRRLAESKHTVGIIPLCTFNNFAKSLHGPTTVNQPIRPTN